MKPDDGLRGILRSHLGGIGHWISIETGASERGVPDTNICVRGGREVWIECKRATANAVRFKPGQPGWLFTRWRFGGVALVAVRQHAEAGARKLARDDLYLVSGQYARELAVGGLSSVPHLGHWTGGPGKWDWSRIRWIIENER